MKRAITVAEIVLVGPTLLFFAALFLRNFAPADDRANAAEQVVLWYAGRQWTLWVLLIALPLAALVLGALTLVQSWSDDAAVRRDARQVLSTIRAHMAITITAAATASAAIALLLVGLHMAAS